MIKASRIALPATAFSTERKRGKAPRAHDLGHLDFIRALPCTICGSHEQVHAAHIRARSTQFKKRQAGLAEKPDDKWTVPLCEAHHLSGDDAQHKGNEIIWWARQGIDPFALALMLYACRGDREEAEELIADARRSAVARD